MQLGRVVRRWRKLLQHLPPDSCGRLLHPHNRRVPKITFYEKHHLFVPHQDIIAADGVQPSLYRCFYSRLIFICAHACGGLRWRDGGNQGFGIGGDEVVSELYEFAMCAADITELSCAKLGEICLPQAVSGVLVLRSDTRT